MATDNYDEVNESGQTAGQSGPADSHGDVDLEQYGVWVKAGPEDVDEEPQQGEDDFELSDLGDFGEDMDESEGLTDEEEDLLAGLEEEEGTTTLEGAEAPAGSQDESGLEDLDIDLDEEFGEESGEAEGHDLALSSGDAVDLSLPEDLEGEEESELNLDEDTEREIDELTAGMTSADVEEDDELDLESLDSIEVDGEPVSLDAAAEPTEETPEGAGEAAPAEKEGGDESAAEEDSAAQESADALPSLGDEVDEDLTLEEIDLEDEDLDLDLDLDGELSAEGEEETAVEEEIGAPEIPVEEAEPAAETVEGEGPIPEEVTALEEVTAEAPGEEEQTEEETEIDLESLPSDSELEEFTFDESGLEEEDSAEELPELETEEEFFDDVSAVQSEMTEPTEDVESPESELAEADEPEPQERGESFAPQGADVEEAAPREEAATAATEQTSQPGSEALSALAGIERELSAIKSELTDLRAELANLRAREPEASREESVAPEAQVSTEPPFETRADEELAAVPSADDLASLEAEAEEEAGGTGFFDDDEDETIALTGDELDHILDSAEFTEETGTPTELEDLYADSGELPQGEEGAEEAPSEETFTQEAPSTEAPSEEAPSEEAPSEKDAFQQREPIEEITLEDLEEEEPEELELEELEPEESEIGEPQEFLVEEPVAEEREPEQPEDEEHPSEPLEDLEMVFGEEPQSRQEAEAAETPTEDEGRSEDLADMDIDSELADIEELTDEDEDDSVLDTSEVDSIDLDLDIVEQPEEFKAQDLGHEADEVEGSSAGTEEPDLEKAPGAPASAAATPAPSDRYGEPTARGYEGGEELPEGLREEIKSVLSYMDQLLEALPEEKIQEFAQSEHFEVYKRLFEELGLDN